MSQSQKRVFKVPYPSMREHTPWNEVGHLAGTIYAFSSIPHISFPIAISPQQVGIMGKRANGFLGITKQQGSSCRSDRNTLRLSRWAINSSQPALYGAL